MKSFNFLIAIFTIFLFSSSAVADDQNYKDAGEFYEINYLLLKAIAQTESGQNPNAVNCANSNGTCDYGIMQVNSVHLSTLKKNGIPVDKLPTYFDLVKDKIPNLSVIIPSLRSTIFLFALSSLLIIVLMVKK